MGELQAAGAEAAFFAADLTKEGQPAELIDWTLARFGRLDVLVNNAGVGARRSSVAPADSPGERLRKVMRANFEAAYHVSARALPPLRAAGGGSIASSRHSSQECLLCGVKTAWVAASG
jgi:NAD(P)-dependent dehydrogenase (short-subunit alcohol dehydrogenase family)